MANIQTFVNIRKFSNIKLADKPVVLNFKPFSFHLINKLCMICESQILIFIAVRLQI